MVLLFTHIPFVVNHTINATPPERLQHIATNWSMFGEKVSKIFIKLLLNFIFIKCRKRINTAKSNLEINVSSNIFEMHWHFRIFLMNIWLNIIYVIEYFPPLVSLLIRVFSCFWIPLITWHVTQIRDREIYQEIMNKPHNTFTYPRFQAAIEFTRRIGLLLFVYLRPVPRGGIRGQWPPHFLFTSKWFKLEKLINSANACFQSV